MLLVSDVLKAIDSFAPFDTSCEWDNTGLIIGSPDQKVTGVAVSLDATEQAITEAIVKGCSCLVTHHPLIFEPLSNINTGTPMGRKIRNCLGNGLAVISAHTNWDLSPRGVNAILGSMIGLVDATPLDSGEAGSGMGLFGAFGKAQEGDELPGMILRKWELSWVKYYNVPQTVSRLAVVGGSGGDLWPLALERGADVLVTADMKYHQIMEAVENGLGIIVADHGEMERVTINELARLLSGLLQTVVVTVDTGGFSAGRVSIS